MNASGVFVASNLHVDMGKTIVQSIRSKHFWIFTMLGYYFARPSGDHIFGNHKNTMKLNIKFHGIAVGPVPARNLPVKDVF